MKPDYSIQWMLTREQRLHCLILLSSIYFFNRFTFELFICFCFMCPLPPSVSAHTHTHTHTHRHPWSPSLLSPLHSSPGGRRGPLEMVSLSTQPPGLPSHWLSRPHGAPTVCMALCGAGRGGRAQVHWAVDTGPASQSLELGWIQDMGESRIFTRNILAACEG